MKTAIFLAAVLIAAVYFSARMTGFETYWEESELRTLEETHDSLLIEVCSARTTNRATNATLSKREQDFMCCLSKSLANCTFCIVKQSFFTEGYFSWQIPNGTLDTEQGTNVVKKYPSNPSYNMTFVIESCEFDDISVVELTSCSQMATFFHCFFANLYNFNETGLNYNMTTESNLESAFSDQTTNDATEFVTDATEIDNSTNDLEFESATDFTNIEYVEDIMNFTDENDGNVVI